MNKTLVERLMADPTWPGYAIEAAIEIKKLQVKIERYKMEISHCGSMAHMGADAEAFR